MYVCIDGFRVVWPLEKLEEERECWLKFSERLRLVEIAHVNPGDPVESWIENADRQTLIRLASIVDALETVDGEKDRDLKSAMETEVALMVERFRQSDLLTKPVGNTR
jgi:hypothetical protein